MLLLRYSLRPTSVQPSWTALLLQAGFQKADIVHNFRRDVSMKAVYLSMLTA